MKRKQFKEFLQSEYKLSTEQFAAKDPSEQGTLHAAWADHNAEWIEAENKKTEKNIEEIGKALTDLQQATTSANLELQKALKQQGLVLQQMLDQKGNVADEFAKKLEGFFEKIKDGESKGELRGREFVMKISDDDIYRMRTKATVTAASVANNTDAYRVSTIGQLAHRRLKVYDLFNKIPVGENSNGTVRYSDWIQADITRGASNIAENGTFPASTAKWGEFTLNLEKIGDTIPMTYESTRDRARFVAELDAFLRTNVDLRIDQQLYDGNGTTPNIKGVYTSATSYTPVASGIVDANIFDLIRKVRTAGMKGKDSKYMFNVCMMNADDIDKMLLKKDGENNYVRPDFFQILSSEGVNVYVVAGILIIESNAVTANTMLVGDSRFATIYEEGGYEIILGFATGDFENDRTTLKARKRLAMLVREADKEGWLKVTNIDSALTTIAS